ncbi:OmpA family protein [Flagellimonas allohymeniacidonis]|nr:OmpA family protein [Allomuricauda hymeniacidonis]
MDVLVEDVSLPTSSSGDYFNPCSNEDFGVPANFKGSQAAAEGSAYIGLYFYALNDYREYVQLNTAKTLREKHPYKISFQISRAEHSQLALKTMSIVLVNKKIKVPNSSVLTHSRLDLQEDVQFQEVQLKADGSMTETDGWVTLTAEFDAKGFENHILLGNFETNENTQLLKHNEVSSSSDFSYYYVDNFILEELPRVNYEKDKIYVMEQNPFEPKGYELDAKAMASIQKIFKYLKENAEVQMKITGHADNIGTSEYNKFISSLRARAVALHLKKLGIDDDRIVWEGVGDTKPLRNGKIKSSNFEDGRVEFVMTKFDDQ